jgi:hypothetical protein
VVGREGKGSGNAHRLYRCRSTRGWDLTAIAASGHPSARKLIGDVLLASASIPGAFPPVPIELFERGYEMARAGYPWERLPPAIKTVTIQ